MAIPQLIELEVTRVSQRHQTAKGNFWIECATNQGVVAVWGKAGNMANITAIEARTPPFKATCGCIPSNWPEHAFWVPEYATMRLA
jgi:hypothetical protein